MNKFIQGIIKFFNNIKGKFLELVHKDEEPNEYCPEPTSLLTPDIVATIEAVEDRFTGSMSLKSDILAKIYLEKRMRSVKDVASIFQVSETTIRRRQKSLCDRMTEINLVLNAKFYIDGPAVLKEYYGPTFIVNEFNRVYSIEV